MNLATELGGNVARGLFMVSVVLLAPIAFAWLFWRRRYWREL